MRPLKNHLKNIFESGELHKEAVVAFFATTATDEKTYQNERSGGFGHAQFSFASNLMKAKAKSDGGH